MKDLKWLMLPVAAYLIVDQVAPRVSAYYSANENTILRLEGCNSEACDIKGTFKVDPLTLEKYIVQDDGSRIYFDTNKVVYMSWPTPKDS